MPSSRPRGATPPLTTSTSVSRPASRSCSIDGRTLAMRLHHPARARSRSNSCGSVSWIDSSFSPCASPTATPSAQSAKTASRPLLGDAAVAQPGHRREPGERRVDQQLGPDHPAHVVGHARVARPAPERARARGARSRDRPVELADHVAAERVAHEPPRPDVGPAPLDDAGQQVARRRRCSSMRSWISPLPIETNAPIPPRATSGSSATWCSGDLTATSAKSNSPVELVDRGDRVEHRGALGALLAHRRGRGRAARRRAPRWRRARPRRRPACAAVMPPMAPAADDQNPGHAPQRRRNVALRASSVAASEAVSSTRAWTLRPRWTREAHLRRGAELGDLRPATSRSAP